MPLVTYKSQIILATCVWFHSVDADAVAKMVEAS